MKKEWVLEREGRGRVGGEKKRVRVQVVIQEHTERTQQGIKKRFCCSPLKDFEFNGVLSKPNIAKVSDIL